MPSATTGGFKFHGATSAYLYYKIPFTATLGEGKRNCAQPARAVKGSNKKKYFAQLRSAGPGSKRDSTKTNSPSIFT